MSDHRNTEGMSRHMHGYADMPRRMARRVLSECGGYLLRSGVDDSWIVVEYPEVALGFRDADAYGRDILAVSDEEWERANWDESRLSGYTG